MSCDGSPVLESLSSQPPARRVLWVWRPYVRPEFRLLSQKAVGRWFLRNRDGHRSSQDGVSSRLSVSQTTAFHLAPPSFNMSSTWGYGEHSVLFQPFTGSSHLLDTVLSPQMADPYRHSTVAWVTSLRHACSYICLCARLTFLHHMPTPWRRVDSDPARLAFPPHLQGPVCPTYWPTALHWVTVHFYLSRCWINQCVYVVSWDFFFSWKIGLCFPVDLKKKKFGEIFKPPC